MTKKELLEENEELKEALSKIKEDISDLLDEDESGDDDDDDTGTEE
jgi:hypothetical protein